uniref:Uncharacterized protein n=1 Tax=Parascaris univalens TaxID=6257 RepID=A0A915BAW0_PARUN
GSTSLSKCVVGCELLPSRTIAAAVDAGVGPLYLIKSPLLIAPYAVSAAFNSYNRHISLLPCVGFISNFAKELELLSNHLGIPRHCVFEFTLHFKIAYGSHALSHLSAFRARDKLPFVSESRYARINERELAK